MRGIVKSINGCCTAIILSIIFSLATSQTYGLDYPHDSINSIGCDSCHFIYGTEPALLPPWTAHTPQDIDDTQYNTLCWSCHNDVDAPYVKTHSSLQIDNSYGTWTVECRVCHNPHYQKQFRTYGSASYLYSGALTGITSTTITKTDAGWTVDAYTGLVVVPNVLQKNYNYKILSNTADTLTVEGPINLSKASVGNTFAIVYGNLINDTIDLIKITITPAKSGSKTTRFFRTTGSKSFADGDGTYDGVCEVCHTQTTHFRNNGSGSNQLHTNVGTPAGTNCTTCHSHSNGFRHGGGGGTGCGDASSCHGTRESHPTHVGGSGMQLSLACSECHNTSSFPLFKDGQNLANTTACNPCHSPGGTYDGVNNANYGVKNNWTTGVYTGNALQAGKEKWCATCHDESPSVISGVTAPKVIGDEAASYRYGTGYGYYKTGHGLSSGETYPASGGVTAGAGIECGSCHDFSLAHIDGNPRTFTCSNGCDWTEYRQGYRLKLVSGQMPMKIPLVSTPANVDQFRLCFSCHPEDGTGPFFNQSNQQTNFRNGANNNNLHAEHLNLENQHLYPADYNYGGGTVSSQITCMTCHNVHGSTRYTMVRDGKLINREPGIEVWYYKNVLSEPLYGSIDIEPPNPDMPLSASTGWVVRPSSTGANICSGTCHGNGNLVVITRSPFQDVEQIPHLSWAGTPNFISDGVHPDSAKSGSSYEFRVKYTDTNNDTPVFNEVWVDLDDNGDYNDPGEKQGMSEYDVNDTNYVNGTIYKKDITIIRQQDNTIKYRFYFSDGAVADGPPTNDSTLLVTNNIPVLTWTGETGYASDGVNPNSGTSGSSFTFRVRYTDADGQAPSGGINLYVDTNGDGSDELIAMDVVDTLDNNYTDGKLYKKENVAITKVSGGNVTYRFSATDGLDSATGTPATGATITITGGTNAPVLAWTGESGYTTGGVTPNPGASKGKFAFRVTYTDADNNAPSGGVFLYVDTNGDASEETITMDEADPQDTDYSDGKIFKKDDVIITKSGGGSVNYYFGATDGSNPAAGQPTQSNTLTVRDSIVVNCNGGDDYTTIQAAINAASANKFILVKECTYYENLTLNNKNITIQSVNGAAVTIINGGSAGKVLTIQGGDTSTINGFTITNGSTGSGGGGIYLTNGSPTIRNSIITANSSGTKGSGIYATGSSANITVIDSTISNNGVSSGSGIYLESSATAAISGTTISGNSASSGNYGGGIYLASGTSSTITNSTISGNGADNNGSAVYMAGTTLNMTNVNITGNTPAFRGTVHIAGGTAIITGGTFSGNSSTDGGGIYCSGGTANISGLTISGNTAAPGSGGIGGGIYSACSMTVTNSTISGNNAAHGGGIYYANGSLTLTGVTVSGNTGGFGGGVRLSGSGSVNINSSIIRGNDATNGGGIYCNSGSAALTNVIVSGNRGNPAGGGQGGGMYAGCSTTVINSTFAGNRADKGGGVYGSPVVKNSIFWGNISVNTTVKDQIDGTPTVTYTDIDDTGYAGSSGNIRQEPFFAEWHSYSEAPTAAGDYHILTGSPAINAANNADAPADDIDAQSRARSGGDPADMGADEYLYPEAEAPVVTAFTVPSSSTGLLIPVTSFTATDNTGVTGYIITTSATQPQVIGVIWLATSPTIYTVGSAGTYTLYPWVKDAAGNVSAAFDSPRMVTVDTTAPSVSSTVPSNGATNIALNSTVTINWNENMDCASVTVETVTISPSVGWSKTSCSGSQAVFTTSGQSGSTSYTVTLSTTIKDANGRAMVSGYQFSYTTVPPTVAAPTIGTPSALSTTSIRWNFTDNASNEEGFKLHDSGNTLKASAATPDLSYLDETGLTANTQYTRHVHAYMTGEDSLASSDASRYTLSAAPNVTADKTTSTWYDTADVIFTNAAGFGAGGVQYYRFVWNQTASYSFNDTETQWSSGTLTRTSTSEGSWYLHIKSYNGNNAANGTQDYGPFNYDGTVLTVSSTVPTNGATGVALNGSVTINWSQNVDCTTVTTSNITMSAGGWAFSSCSGSQAVFTTSGQSMLTAYTVTVTTNVKEASGRPMDSNYQFSFTTSGVTNDAPVLSWTGETNYTTDGVNPNSGAAGTNFIFRVKYTDANNDAPTVRQVWIDRNDDGDFLDANEKETMDEVDAGDTTYSDGKLYSKTLTLAYNGDGVLNYRFYASDGTDDATGAPTSNSTVTVVNPRLVPSQYATIAAAITASSAGDIILVSDGSYTGNLTLDNKDITIQSVNGAGVTTITGGGSTKVITFQNGDSSIIDGFRITGGSGNPGGGLYISSSQPTIKNSTITSNNGGASGGGMYITGASSNVTLTDSTVSSHSGSNGSGIHLTTSGASITISGSTISGNNASSGRYGGGLYMTAGTSATITNTTFSGNRADNHGSAIYFAGTTLNLTNVNFTGNDPAFRGTIYQSGGTMTVTGGTFSSNNATYGAGTYCETSGILNISGNAAFTSNTAGLSSSGQGGAIYSSGCTVTVSDTTITSNSSGGSGGGIYSTGGLTMTNVTVSGNTGGNAGGGIYQTGLLTMNRCVVKGNYGGNGAGINFAGTAGSTIKNTIISGNKTSNNDGGGIYGTSNLSVINVTVAGNKANGQRGGGIRGAVAIRNSIIWGNDDQYGSGCGKNVYSGPANAYYSDIQCDSGTYAGTGNINSDPRFINLRPASEAQTTAGNYHLCNGAGDPDAACAASSPCIDTADATSAPTDDIDSSGAVRPYDVPGKGDGVNDYDMGADEYLP